MERQKGLQIYAVCTKWIPHELPDTSHIKKQNNYLNFSLNELKS